MLRSKAGIKSQILFWLRLDLQRLIDDVICVNIEELKTVLASMGEKLSDREVADMLREADANGDGVIDFSGN